MGPLDGVSPEQPSGGIWQHTPDPRRESCKATAMLKYASVHQRERERERMSLKMESSSCSHRKLRKDRQHGARCLDADSGPGGGWFSVLCERLAQRGSAPSPLKLGALLIKTSFLPHKPSCYAHTQRQAAGPQAAALQQAITKLSYKSTDVLPNSSLNSRTTLHCCDSTEAIKRSVSQTHGYNIWAERSWTTGPGAPALKVYHIPASL